VRLHPAAQRPQLVALLLSQPPKARNPDGVARAVGAHREHPRKARIPRCRHKGPLWRQHSWRFLLCLSSASRSLENGGWHVEGVGMSRMTGTTVVTAGLGTLVLLNAVLSWGTQRPEPRPQQDIPHASPATLDPAVALQLRSGAWRRSSAAEPASTVFSAPPPPDPPAQVQAPAARPILPVASPAEVSPALDRGVPLEQLTHSMAPPSSPAEGSQAALPSAATPPTSLPTVSRPPPGKDRMLLAGPATEAATSAEIEQGGPTAPDPPQAELPGNAGPAAETSIALKATAAIASASRSSASPPSRWRTDQPNRRREYRAAD